MQTMAADAIRLLLFPALMAFAASSDLLTMPSQTGCRSRSRPASSCWRWSPGWTSTPSACPLLLPRLCWPLVRLLFARLDRRRRCEARGGNRPVVRFSSFARLSVVPRFLAAYSLWPCEFRKLPLPGVLTRQAWIMRLHDSAGDVPYGIALAAAALAVYPKTVWMPGYGL